MGGRGRPAEPEARVRVPTWASGYGLLEALVSLALLLVLLQAAAPIYARWTERLRLRGAARHLALRVTGLRVAAAAARRTHGMVFNDAPQDGDLEWRLAEDGDGDGLRRGDLASGVDRYLSSAVRLDVAFPGVLAGLPPTVGPPGGASAGRGGVAFGRSRILAASPAGSASPGSLYLRNRNGESVALRVYGPTGRLTLWWWAPEEARWTLWR